MRKPGFGQRPFGARPGRGTSEDGRRSGGPKRSRPAEGRGDGASAGERKPRFSGEGKGAGGTFKPRDGKRPFKRDGERSERGERAGGEERAGGGFKKGPRPFKHGQDRGEYTSRPPREGEGFRKRPFRKDEGGRPSEERGERSERSFGGKGRFERKGPPRERFGGEGGGGGDRPRRDGKPRGEGKPYDGPRREGWKPRDRFAGDRAGDGGGDRRRDGKPRSDRPARDAWKPREDRGGGDRERSRPDERGEPRFRTRPFDKTKRPFDAKGDRPPRRDDRPAGRRDERRDDRRDDRGGARGDRVPRERPPVGRLLPDRDEQAARSGQRPQGGFKKREFSKDRPEPQKAGPAVTQTMRIAKAMARAGLCSRREAERWIADGRVSINGEVLSSAAHDVTPKDRVLVDGRPLPAAEPPQLWRYYKPKGLVTTHHDPEGRPTVFDTLPPELPRVVSVGRLDFNTEGLILLTNDGELARHLELPATGWLRRYRVRAKGRVDQAALDALKEGVEIDGVRYGAIEATLDTEQGANVWLTVGIREGKNREVRRVLGSLGLEVNRLIRISFGPFQLLDLKPGEVERVRRRVLFDQLGPQLAAELGIEMPEPAAKAPEKKPKKPKAEVPVVEDEPEWQLLEETDIVLDELESDDDDGDEDASPEEGSEDAPE